MHSGYLIGYGLPIGFILPDGYGYGNDFVPAHGYGYCSGYNFFRGYGYGIELPGGYITVAIPIRSKLTLLVLFIFLLQSSTEFAHPPRASTFAVGSNLPAHQPLVPPPMALQTTPTSSTPAMGIGRRMSGPA